MAKNNKKDKSYIPILWIIILPLLAVIVSSFAVLKGVQNYITTSNYFRIRELKIEGISDKRYLDLIKGELLGVNIFRVDTEKLAGRIKKKFPTFYNVLVNRVLPSQLLITAKARLPVAFIKRDVYYLFDAEGVVLSSFSLNEAISFPVIIGLENKLQKIKIGADYQNGLLQKALLLAKALRVQGLYSGPQARSSIKVTKIDVTNLSDMSFYFGEEICVKVGDKDLVAKIDLFPAILRSIGVDLANVKYIDLRPKEPVVAMKDKKKSV